MSEILQIFVGQSGSQISQSVIELICAEHHISKDGDMHINFIQTQNEKKSVLFYESQSGKFITRSIVIDLDPDPINQIKKGSLNKLFSKDNLISDKQDAQSIFTYGAYLNNQCLEKALNQIRIEVEKCSNLMGFIFYSSSQGGSAGLLDRIIQRLKIHYSKKTRVSIIVQPSQNFSNIIVEPYNHIYTLSGLRENCDLNIMIDNEQIYNIYKSQFEMEYPSFQDINHYIAQVASQLTLPTRFPEMNSITLSDLGINLVPFPQMNFIIPSLGKNLLVEQKYSNQNTYDTNQKIYNMVSSCFNSETSLLNVNLMKGKFLACTMMFRGDIQMKKAIDQINLLKLKKKLQFVDWLPNPFKIGINSQKITELNDQCLAKCDFSQLALINNSCYKDNIHQMEVKYDRLYRKRAFVHWFVGIGIRSSQFNCCREDVAALYKDYEEVIL